MGKFELTVLKFSMSCSPKRGRLNTELCTFCTETKESLLHLFWECTYSKKKWFSLVNVFKNCGLNMQYINAPNIILGIMNPLDGKV
jgi:hypothetical protein